MLRIAIENLGELADEMVFVGGCMTGVTHHQRGGGGGAGDR